MSPRRHLTADLLDSRTVKDSRGNREHLSILNRDVTLIQRLENREMRTHLLEIRQGKAIIGKPAPYQLVDSGVMALGFTMVVFECIK